MLIFKKVFLILFLGFCLFTPKRVLAQELKSSEKLFKSRCSQCHSLSQAYDVDSVLPSSWKETVKGMQRKSESNINDTEAQAIYEFLVYDTTKKQKKKLEQELQAIPKDKQQTEQAEIDRIKKLFS